MSTSFGVLDVGRDAEAVEHVDVVEGVDQPGEVVDECAFLVSDAALADIPKGPAPISATGPDLQGLKREFAYFLVSRGR